jgi:transposase
MHKPKNRITKEMLKTLRGESSRERLLHRLHCVAMALNGSSASEAARIYGDSPRAVAYWVTRFKKHGIEGLEEEARPGRPSRLNDAQLAKLQIYMKQAQGQHKLVNADTLSTFILNKFEISLTPRQCLRILNRLST